jgi:uncharacterized membrane protein
MLIYSLVLNILLIISIVGLYVYLLRTKTRLRVMFLRAWGLELKLMELFNKTDNTSIQKEIETTLHKITPVE